MVGSIVLATDQGLGYLAKSFFDHGLIHKVFIQRHSTRPNHPEWYPPDAVVSDPMELLAECSTLLFFENVWSWKIIVEARKKGIKTVLMPMYECTRNPPPYDPDLILCPSLLDLHYFKKMNAMFLPVPVDVEWRERTRARVFVHNAGNGGLGGRNGTKELLEAMRWVKAPLKLIVRSQKPITVPGDPRIEFTQGQVPAHELWATGDVFIFPEKFNGLSLPLQEAYAAGMLVMAGDRFPINSWLVRDPLIPVAGYSRQRIAVEFNMAEFSTKQIAATMDAWYDRDISGFSRMGREWAEKHSWRELKGQYEMVLGLRS